MTVDQELAAACAALGIRLDDTDVFPDAPRCQVGGCHEPAGDRFCPRHAPVFSGRRSRMLPREETAELATRGWSIWPEMPRYVAMTVRRRRAA